MNRNQFFYTRVVEVPAQAGDAAGATSKTIEFRDSFALSKVVRSIQLEDMQVLVLLDDIHERMLDIPVYNKKNERTGTRKERATVQTEVYLSPLDGERFFKLTNIEE